MAKNLVIVESPAKSKTIKKFLGSNYKIEASMGHIRDLPKSQLGVNVEEDFEPKYITIRGKGELLANLKKEAKKATKIYLATDPDREGEAISWHLYHLLKTDKNKVYRISFNEITKDAVKNAIKSAREIDMDLVDAQQARRILDRVVGYKISPLLWKKVKKGLSAGRVQSVALKLICEKEKEINSFIPEEYWTIDANIKADKKVEFNASFYGDLDKKVELKNKEEVDKVLENIKGATFSVDEIKKSERVRNTLPPFTTSTMQQEASKKLNFGTVKTMRVAQQLYEGVEIKGRGTIGLITYLRTDSTRISEEAHRNVCDYIAETYGKEFVAETIKQKKSNSKTQDAHEAIRPTYLEVHPSEVKESLTREQFRLYELIWNRFVASRMTQAKFDYKKIMIKAGDYRFRTSIQVIKFEGFLKVYKNKEEKLNKKGLDVEENSVLEILSIGEEQHFTQPPARYTEAALVKTLEENGVGRPSTYAPTISTVTKRGYVGIEEKRLFPTELGEVVFSILQGYFTDVIDVRFTADLEKRLDEVEAGELFWKEVLREFYPDFAKLVEVAEEEVSKIEIKDEVTDVICENCGKNMVIKMGKYGKFLACPGFPECHNTKALLEKVEGVNCPKCGDGDVLVRKTKKGRRYYGCSNYPECDYMSWNKPTTVPCKVCGSMTYEKGKKLLCSNEDCMNIQEKEE